MRSVRSWCQPSLIHNSVVEYDRMSTTAPQRQEDRTMPGRQTVRYAGLEFRAEPDFWPRRLFRFPFFFESTNPSFRVKITRVSYPPEGEGWPGDTIPMAVHFADDTGTLPPCPLPALQIGQYTIWRLTGVYSPHPGRTALCLLTRSADLVSVHNLYTYQVRPEEQLWLALLAPVVAIASGAIGFLIERWLG